MTPGAGRSRLGRKRALLLLVSSAFIAMACEREPSMAVKSASAYAEAVAQGEEVGSGHGGHEVPGHEHPSSAAGVGAPRAMEQHEAAAGMHAKAHQGAPDMPSAAHAQAGHATPRAGMDHSESTTPQGPTTTGGMAAHAAHSVSTRSAVVQTGVAVFLPGPDSSRAMAALDPAATLREDDLDRPASSSIAETRKAGAVTPRHHFLPRPEGDHP